MNDTNATAFTRPSDGLSGDVLERLQTVLDTTPIHSHVTRPLPRSLIRVAAGEIARLRSENAALLASQASPSHSQP